VRSCDKTVDENRTKNSENQSVVTARNKKRRKIQARRKNLGIDWLKIKEKDGKKTVSLTKPS